MAPTRRFVNMPRLRDVDYLVTHHELRERHLGPNRNAFLLLRPNEQWDLFKFYLPQGAGDDATMLQNRKIMTESDPSLPQRAGRAYKRFLLLDERLPRYIEERRSRPRPKKNSNTKYEISVFSEVRRDLKPEDVYKLLVRIAEYEAEKEKNGLPAEANRQQTPHAKMQARMRKTRRE